MAAFGKPAPGGKPVALRVVDNLDVNILRQELKALELTKRLSHPHLLALDAYWFIDADGNAISGELWNEPSAAGAEVLIVATKLGQMNLQQPYLSANRRVAPVFPPMNFSVTCGKQRWPLII